MIAKIIGALFKIPLTNLLGGTGMGYFSCAYGLFLPVYAISVTGLPTAVAKLVAENTAFGRYANAKKIKRVSLILFTLIGIFSAGLMVLLSGVFSEHIVETPSAKPAVLAIAPSVLFGCIMSVYRGYYEGLRNMYPTAVSQVIEGLVKLAAGLLFCKLTMDFAVNSPTEFLEVISKLQPVENLSAEDLMLPYSAAAAVLGVTLSSFGGMIFLILRHKLSGDGITKAMTAENKYTDSGKSLLKALIKILVPVALGSLVTNLTSLIDLATIVRCLNSAIEKAPKYFIGMSVPISEMSTFIYGSFTGLTLTVFNLVPSFANMFGKGILPSLAEAWAVKDKSRIEKSVNSVLFVTGLVAIPAGLGITALAREILEFLYSSRTNEILASYQSLAVLGAGVILLSLTAPMFAMLQAIGRADLPVKIMLLGVAVKLAGNLLLIPIPAINITGAGISTTFCYLVICVTAVSSLRRVTGVKIRWGTVFIKPLYAGILCIMGAVPAYNFLFPLLGNMLSLPISIAIGGIIYLLSLYLLEINTKNQIKSLF